MNDNKSDLTTNASESIVDRLQTPYDPADVIRRAEEKLQASQAAHQDDDGEEESDGGLTDENPVLKAMTLSEFSNGILLSSVVPERYRTFGINMLRQLQVDYNCTIISEMAIAEHATISYIRTLEIQRIMDASLARPDKHTVNLQYIGILSKELDRASRQFLNAIQTLRMFKQPTLKVNIKTNTAIVGQNQLIQENQNVNPI